MTLLFDDSKEIKSEEIEEEQEIETSSFGSDDSSDESVTSYSQAPNSPAFDD